MSGEMSVGLLGLGVGFGIGKFLNPGSSSANGEGTSLQQTDIEAYTAAIAQLAEARQIIASYIAAESRLKELTANLELDPTSKELYEQEIARLSSELKLLYQYVERNVSGFTPGQVIGETVVTGITVRPNVVFDRDIKENNLYIDANNSIAIRGIKSVDIPVDVYLPGTTTVVTARSSASPTQPIIQASLTGVLANSSLMIGLGAKQKIRTADNYVTASHNAHLSLLIEFDKQVDLRTLYGRLSILPRNMSQVAAGSRAALAGAGFMSVIPLRANVILVKGLWSDGVFPGWYDFLAENGTVNLTINSVAVLADGIGLEYISNLADPLTRTKVLPEGFAVPRVY